MKRSLKSYIRPYLFLAIISPLMMMLEVLADLCLPFLMSYIVDYGILENGLKAIRADGGIAWSVMHLLYGESFTQFQIVITFGVLMLLITLVGGFFGVFCAYTSARAAQSFGNDLRRDPRRVRAADAGHPHRVGKAEDRNDHQHGTAETDEEVRPHPRLLGAQLPFQTDQ